MTLCTVLAASAFESLITHGSFGAAIGSGICPEWTISETAPGHLRQETSCDATIQAPSQENYGYFM